jgi:hypothetical protein
MREIVTFTPADTMPERSAIMANQGIPADADPGKRIEEMIDRARKDFAEVAQPRGIMASVTLSEFADIYRGEGMNETETPVGEVFPRATKLVLFAVTMGQEVSRKIDRLFASAEFAQGSMLDSVASAAADRAAELLEYQCLEKSVEAETVPPETAVLRYSPGYCGWHISGQKKLFAGLHPEDISITLRRSYLMEPLKSVSGVFILGPAIIHEYNDSYPFCAECRDHSCRYRTPVVLGR